MTAASRVARIADFGQQIWLDKLSRTIVASGELAQWLSVHRVAGVTSNPAIFAQALAGDPAYASDLQRLRQSEPSAERRFEQLAIADIQAACDALLALHQQSGGQAGYVSFEVSPRLARDTEGTKAAAARLWAEINRPNAMIKIPATDEGLPAIRASVARGIPINVTLIFNERQTRGVFEAFLDGLQDRLNAGQSIRGQWGVASIFISRIDTAADKLLPAGHPLRGQLGIASARSRYALWKSIFESARFAPFAAAGALPPWCLWASTGTKNPDERDTRYVEALIGERTVNTAPDATLKAFVDHGEAARTLDPDLGAAQAMVKQAEALGIDLETIGEQLQRDGLLQFDQAFDKLLTLVA